LLFCLAACSDDEDGGAGVCAAVEPCGGDIVGQWQIESLCFSRDQSSQAFESGLPPECRGSFLSADAVVEGGTVDYGADGSVTTAGTARVHVEYHLAATCLASSFPGLDPNMLDGPFCVTFAGRVLAGLDRLTPGEGLLSCSVGNDACDCQTTAQLNMAEVASYAAMGGELMIGESSVPYCVSDDRLQYVASPLGGTIVARR
jgi:hypothetical protein